MAGGDRYLAANITVFRALTISPKDQTADRYRIQATLQQDAAWFNPAHEDNYYLATAALPWNGEVQAAQTILDLATQARPYDILPPFFRAFNQYYFLNDPVGAALYLQGFAVKTENPEDSLWLRQVAANWFAKGKDRNQAIKLLEVLASQSKNNKLREQIHLRSQRLQILCSLDNAISDYIQKFSRRPKSLQELVDSKILLAIPGDPLGDEFFIDDTGVSQTKKRQK